VSKSCHPASPRRTLAAGCQIIGAIKSQGWRDGKQSGHPAGMLSIFSNDGFDGMWPESLTYKPRPAYFGAIHSRKP
jgi:hypothetical protein